MTASDVLLALGGAALILLAQKWVIWLALVKQDSGQLLSALAVNAMMPALALYAGVEGLIVTYFTSGLGFVAGLVRLLAYAVAVFANLWLEGILKLGTRLSPWYSGRRAIWLATAMTLVLVLVAINATPLAVLNLLLVMVVMAALMRAAVPAIRTLAVIKRGRAQSERRAAALFDERLTQDLDERLHPQEEFPRTDDDKE